MHSRNSLIGKTMMYERTIHNTIESLDKLKERMLSRFSHELRTPVTSIVGYAEALLSEPALPSETRQQFIEIIKEEGDRLANLVNELMELFALERGTIKLKMTENDVISVMDFAIKSMLSAAEKKSLTITPFYDQAAIVAMFDKERMFEAFLHLISNAVKFSPQSGNVVITARLDNTNIEIMVSDNGKGIPVQDVPLVFRGFYRVQRPGEEIRGAGMGLAIAKHLIELHGGSIRVVTTEHEGSIFVLRFPLNHDKPNDLKNTTGGTIAR